MTPLKPAPDRILVIHLKRVGDILLATPLVARLRALFPRAKIDFLVYDAYADVLAGNPHLDRVVAYSKSRPWSLPGLVRGPGYDWVIDLLADGASAWACALSGAPIRAAFESRYPTFVHNVRVPKPTTPMYAPRQKDLILDGVLARTELAGPGAGRLIDGRPVLRVDPGRSARWRGEIARLFPGGAGPLVLLSPTSRRATRRWTTEGFAFTARKLAERWDARVGVLWGPGERADAEAVSAAANMLAVKVMPALAEIGDLAAVVAEASCLVTNCNGTRHVAVAVRVPTVTIHMSSDPLVWNPPAAEGPGYHPDHPVVRLDELDCIGCQSNECPRALECARNLPPERVLAAAEALLARRGFRAVPGSARS